MHELWDILNGRIIVASDRHQNLFVTWNRSDVFQVWYVDQGFEDVTFRECQLSTNHNLERDDLAGAIRIAEQLLAES